MPASLVLSLIFISLAVVGLSAGCYGPAPDRDFVIQADRLHDEALASTVVSHSDLGEYVQEIGNRLAEAARQVVPGKTRDDLFAQVRFHLVAGDTVNAFTTGGQHVYVYTGLLRLCETEEELAAAMAHAYAHAVNLDVQDAGVRPDAGPGNPRPLRAVVWQFVANRFTLEQERQADELAFALYARAGWDPQKFSTLFVRLADRPQSPAPDRVAPTNRAAAASANASRAQRKWRRPPVADRQTFAALHRQAAAPRGIPIQNLPDPELFLLAFPNCVLPADLPEQRAAQERLRPPPPPAVKLEPN